MKCFICYKEMLVNINFKNIFLFDFVCKDCKTLYKIKKTTIPIDEGYMIDYYYCTVDDKYEEEIRKKVNKQIYNLMSKSINKIFLYITSEEEIPYIRLFNMCQNINIFSIKYYQFENFL